MNSSYSFDHSISGSIGSTLPFTCEEDMWVTRGMDSFAIGILFAHYLKLIMTGDEWFLNPSSANFSNKKCHEMILQYVNESYDAFISSFGQQYATCVAFISVSTIFVDMLKPITASPPKPQEKTHFEGIHARSTQDLASGVVLLTKLIVILL